MALLCTLWRACVLPSDLGLSIPMPGPVLSTATHVCNPGRIEPVHAYARFSLGVSGRVSNGYLLWR